MDSLIKPSNWSVSLTTQYQQQRYAAVLLGIILLPCTPLLHHPRADMSTRANSAPCHWLNWLVRLLPGTCVQYPGALPHVKQLAQLLWLVPMMLAPPMYVVAHCEPLTEKPGAQQS